MRLLDVGCGWGGMVLHAAATTACEAVGVTISRAPGRAGARSGSPRPGLADRVEIRLQDYRDVDDGPFDAISSIGMFEHVGLRAAARVLREPARAAAPRRAGCSTTPSAGRPSPATAGPSPCRTRRWRRRTFIDRYVFPDGELHEVGSVVSAMQQRRLRGAPRREPPRALRPHPAGLGGQPRGGLGRGRRARRARAGPGSGASTWRRRPSASRTDRIQVHQVLAVKPDHGRSGIAAPARRF